VIAINNKKKQKNKKLDARGSPRLYEIVNDIRDGKGCGYNRKKVAEKNNA
jgi:hypothetical protein